MATIIIPPKHKATQPNVPNVPGPLAPGTPSVPGTGVSGPTTIAGLSDVSITPNVPIDKCVLTYNAQIGKWTPQPIPISRTVYISVSITGLMNPSEVLMQYVLPEAVTIPVGGVAGTFAVASVAAEYNVTTVINKNSMQVGTILWSPGSYSGTINIPSKLYLVAGDVLQLVAPSTTDPSLANIGVTFACVRGG